MKTHNYSLDVVRILAAYMVLFCHIGQYCSFQITGEMRKGVQIFFILSGVLIFMSLENTDSIQNYFQKRIIRIVPIYWVTLCINYLMQLFWCIFIDGNSAYQIISAGPCGIRYLRYFFFLHMLIPSDNYGYWNNAYAVWTLSSFAVFYIIAPVLFRGIKNFWESALITIVALCVRPITIQTVYEISLRFFENEKEIRWFANNTPLNTLYCFLIGITIYFAVKENKQIVVAVFMVLMFVSGQTKWYGYETILALAILVAVTCPIKVGSYEKIVRVLSDSSFALYLIHPALLKLIVYHLNKAEIYGGGRFLILTMGGIGGGVLYWYFVERPTKKMLAKFLTR